MTRNLKNRLDRLEETPVPPGPTRKEYLDACRRVEIATLIGLGFELQEFVMEDFEDYDDGDLAADCDLIELYESSLLERGLNSAADRRKNHREGRERQMRILIRDCENGKGTKLFWEPEVGLG